MNVVGLAGLLLMLVAVAGSGAMVAFLAWLLFRMKRLEEAQVTPSLELRELIQRIEGLREDMQLATDDVAKLSERMDFTERLLSEHSGASRPASPRSRGEPEG